MACGYYGREGMEIGPPLRGSFKSAVPKGFRAGGLAVAVLLLGLVTAVGAAELPGATPGPHRIDDAGLRFLTQERYDNFHSELYNDPAHCTIGFGHLVSYYQCEDPRAAKDVAPFLNGIDKQRGYELLAMDVAKASRCVNDAITVPITQSQFDGLLSFGFNAGCPALKKVAKFVNEGNLDGAASKIKEYNKAEVPVKDKKTGKVRKVKKVRPGLVIRRGQEAQLVDGEKTTAQLLGKGGGGTGSGGGRDCSKDDLNSPPSRGCDRVLVQIATDGYPGDTQLGLGAGVGSVTIQPSGKRLACLNPSNAAACEITIDVAAGTRVTVTPTAGSVSPDPQSPPDSKFQRFEGACSGSGACRLTPSASKVTIVGVDFIPAVVKLTLNASPSSGPEMSANGDTPVAGTDPISPFYCGAIGEPQFPCTALARLYTDVTVQADNAGNLELGLPTFSSNCVPRPAAPDYCDIKMNADETVTATFSGS